MSYELRGIIFKDEAMITELMDCNLNEVIWKSQELPNQVMEKGTCVEARLYSYNGLWRNPKKYPKSWSLTIISSASMPSWFHKEHRKMFRIAADAWWAEHVLMHKEISHLANGFYYLKECCVSTVCGNARIICDNSRIGSVKDTSTILAACGCSVIDSMQDQTLLKRLLDNSIIYSASNSSKIEEMASTSMIDHLRGKAQVDCMCSYSRICNASGQSRISTMEGHSLIHSISENAVIDKMLDSSLVTELTGNAQIKGISGRHAIVPLYRENELMPFN